MFINVAGGPGPGLGALPRRAVRLGARGMGAVVAVPMLVRRGPNPRSGLVVSRGYRGLRGLGDCTNLGTKYSNTPNGACRDNITGSIVDCAAAACGAAAVPAGGGGATYTPVTALVNNDPTLQPITVGGFQGDISVPTLLSALDDMLEAKSGPPEINLLRAGADTQADGLQDFATLAQEHCTEYPNSQGCDNPGPIVQSVQNQWAAWIRSQASNLTPAASPAGSPAGSAGSAGSGSSAGSANAPATVTFTNLSRPSGYVVGDSWRIDLTGPPNAPVSVTASQNGTSLGTTPMGTTDSNGRASLSGSFAAGTVGNWRELFTIGASPAPLLAFTVAAAPAQPSAGAGNSSGAGSGGTGSGSGSGGSGPSGSAAAGSCYQFFGGANDTCIGPVGQMTALVGGGLLLGLLWMFGGKR